MRRILVVALTSALLLAGCGSDSSGLDAVSVGKSKNPTVKVEKGFTATATDTRVVAEGSGEAVKDGDVVKINYVAVNGRTGKQFDNSFKAESPMTVTLQEGSILPGFVKGLTGQKIGSRVLVAIPPKDGFGQKQDQLGIEKDDTMVFLFDLVAKVPTEATGEEQKLPAASPQVVLEGGKPSGVKKTADTPKDPKDAKLYLAIKGEGDKIAKDATVTAHYVGQVYPDGKVFDESWSKDTPASFQLSGLVKCWQDLVPGQTVGSRVVLVCPADTAYGDSPPEGGTIKAGDTLTFVIDLLDAS